MVAPRVTILSCQNWNPNLEGIAMSKPAVLVFHWLPDGELARWASAFPQFEFVDARRPEFFDQHKDRAVICYGIPELEPLGKAPNLRWIQLASAGVPSGLCQMAQSRKIVVSNLAGLYGPSI